MVDISEKDLYDFVFNKDSITSDKKRYIDLNEHLFKDQLSLLYEIKDKSNDSLDDEIIEKIRNKFGDDFPKL